MSTPAGPDPAASGNHLVLTVADLPTDENPSGGWYVDAGLGDVLHEPMPLAEGSTRRGRSGWCWNTTVAPNGT